MARKKPASLFYREEFGLASYAAIRALGKRIIRVMVHLGRGPVESIFHLAPPERCRVRAEWFRVTSERILSRVPLADVRFWRKRPRHMAFTCSLPARLITMLAMQLGVVGISLLAVEGRRPRKERERKFLKWYAVQARFAIQVEGYTRGMQSYEDRILLVKATGCDDAVRRLRREFREYEAPYLNPACEMVRWHFERVLDVQETFLVNDELNQEGEEIFSQIRERRMRPEYEWHPLQEGTQQ